MKPALVLLSLFITGNCLAESVLCNQISSIPYKITVPGRYCLANALRSEKEAGVAISIEANDTTLDLNGLALVDKQGSENLTSVGVKIVGRRNVSVINGTIDGFASSIEVLAPANMITRNVQVKSINAINFRASALVLQGKLQRVADCLFSSSLSKITHDPVMLVGSSALPALTSGIDITGNSFTGSDWYNYPSNPQRKAVQLFKTEGVVIANNSFFGFDIGVALPERISNLSRVYAIADNRFESVWIPYFPAEIPRK